MELIFVGTFKGAGLPADTVCGARDCKEEPSRAFLCQHEELVILCNWHDQPDVCCPSEELPCLG